MNLWWNYRISTAIRFLESAGITVNSVALRIGPLAFVVCWKVKRGVPQLQTPGK